MDEADRQRIANRVLELADGFYLGNPNAQQTAQELIEHALELVPTPVADRAILDEPAVVVEIVAGDRLFTMRAARDDNAILVVAVAARRLADGVVDVELKQLGYRRTWTFHLGEETVRLEGSLRVERERNERVEAERVAQAMAGRMGWATL